MNLLGSPLDHGRHKNYGLAVLVGSVSTFLILYANTIYQIVQLEHGGDHKYKLYLTYLMVNGSYGIFMVNFFTVLLLVRARFEKLNECLR
jgi:hypothetical protein